MGYGHVNPQYDMYMMREMGLQKPPTMEHKQKEAAEDAINDIFSSLSINAEEEAVEDKSDMIEEFDSQIKRNKQISHDDTITSEMIMKNQFGMQRQFTPQEYWPQPENQPPQVMQMATQYRPANLMKYPRPMP